MSLIGHLTFLGLQGYHEADSGCYNFFYVALNYNIVYSSCYGCFY